MMQIPSGDSARCGWWKSCSDMQGKSFWESLKISIVNVAGQAEMAALQSHVWLSLLFCTFPINKQILASICIYLVFKSFTKKFNEDKKRALLFLNKTFSSKTKVFSHFILPGGILFSLINSWLKAGSLLNCKIVYLKYIEIALTF